ncbi:shikimate dehydrogenase [Ruminococcus sp. YE71]|uniref:shikimate dehydrogenase family protein n=1 Tax=unclassified Ruminococcus TaxID=2608920 RepID=UPI00087E083A|nr:MULTISPECIES: shikimate dehydrogenase [unclassified Ruminococcus]SDA31747.1 shikimate dehydrogenase [Ruminococcus sp. YE78]SFW51979.1 shikimate dehydrogenase [Ruminococcus sp. YE71]
MNRSYALLGGKLGHTMSPPIHKALFDLKGRSFTYDIIELTPEALAENTERLRSLAGFNITIPHKVAVIDMMDKLDETAKRYTSVNCADMKDGVLTGYNTDCVGFLEAIKAMGADLGGKVLLAGCGGVGRMMAVEAALAGADLTVAVLESDMPLAEKAAEDIRAMKPDAKITLSIINKVKAEHFDLLMNATPVGMYPKTDACAVSDELIAASDAVFDVIYNPGDTLLLKKAKALGKKTSGGMSMLVWQAVKAHEIWDGDSYTREEVAAIIDEMQRQVDEKFPKA